MLRSRTRSGNRTDLRSSRGETVDCQVRGLNGTRTVVLPRDALFQGIASTETTCKGVMALVRPARMVRRAGVSRLPAWSSCWIGLQDECNAGAIVRAAEALPEPPGLLFLKGTASPYHPKTLRASAGSLFRVPFVAGPGRHSGASDAASTPLSTVGYAYTGAQKAAGATDFVRRCAIVAGSEGRGVSKELHGIAEDGNSNHRRRIAQRSGGARLSSYMRRDASGKDADRQLTRQGQHA